MDIQKIFRCYYYVDIISYRVAQQRVTVWHHQKYVDTSKKKTAACQQYEMMCET